MGVSMRACGLCLTYDGFLHVSAFFFEHISIMVLISYCHAKALVDGIPNIKEEQVIIREYDFYISDDSAFFVQHYFHKEHGIMCSLCSIWSDGCGAQFKSARQFYWLYRWHQSRGV